MIWSYAAKLRYSKWIQSAGGITRNGVSFCMLAKLILSLPYSQPNPRNERRYCQRREKRSLCIGQWLIAILKLKACTKCKYSALFCAYYDAYNVQSIKKHQSIQYSSFWTPLQLSCCETAFQFYILIRFTQHLYNRSFFVPTVAGHYMYTTNKSFQEFQWASHLESHSHTHLCLVFQRKSVQFGYSRDTHSCLVNMCSFTCRHNI